MNFLNRYADTVYCIMRLIVVLMFFCHGAQKILGWFPDPKHAAGPLPPLMLLGGWVELVCGLLLAVGLLTRIAAFLASGEMAVGFFMFHASGGSLVPLVNHGELAVAYCFLFLFIFFYGPGAWSIDGLIARSRGAQTAPA